MAGICCFSQWRLRKGQKGKRLPAVEAIALSTPYTHLQEYEAMTQLDSCHPDVWSNLACCFFMLGMYDQAKEAAEKGLNFVVFDGVYCKQL